jgi:hypothetical protein
VGGEEGEIHGFQSCSFCSSSLSSTPSREFGFLIEVVVAVVLAHVFLLLSCWFYFPSQ